MTSVHILNRLPTTTIDDKISYEVLYNKAAEYDHFKVFGCLVFATNPSQSYDKFDAKAVPCVHLGYPPNKKGYILLNLITKQTFLSRDVVFHETIFQLNSQIDKPYMHPVPTFMPNTQPLFATGDDIIVDTDIMDEIHAQSFVHTSPNQPSPPCLRRSSRQHKQPCWMNSCEVTLPHSAQTAQVIDLSVPTQFTCC